MSFKVARKPFRIGTSLAVTLPPAWVNYYRDKLATVTILGGDILLLAPMGMEAKAQEILDEVEEHGD